MSCLDIYTVCIGLLFVWSESGESITEVLYRAGESGNFKDFCKWRIHEDVRLVLVQNPGRDGYVTLPDWTECEQLVHLGVVIEPLSSTSIFTINSFLGLSQLKSLNLKGNRLESLPENVFRDLTSLESLDLGRNELTEVSDFHLSGLNRLTYLGLSRNRITELTVDAITNLKSLRKLDLSNNFLDIIPERTFQHLVNLNKLDISKNRLFTLFECQFSGNKMLTELNASFNKIKEIHNQTFVRNRNLRQIDFSKNKLLSVSGLNYKALAKIEEVNFGFNNLKEFSFKNGLPNSLKRIGLNGNPLECHSSTICINKGEATIVVGQCTDKIGRRHILREINS